MKLIPLNPNLDMRSNKLNNSINKHIHIVQNSHRSLSLSLYTTYVMNNYRENHLNLDLSLGLPQQQDPVEEQGRLVPQEQDPVEEQGHFMQLILTSDPPQNIQPSPPPSHHMTSFVDYFTNGTSPWIVPAQTLPPLSPIPSVSVAAPLPYQPYEQVLHPPQLNQVGTVALQTPRRGRPPGGQARRNSTRADVVERNVGNREIVPPYPWATNKLAGIHTIRDLYAKNINMISGQVHCKPCNRTHTLTYDLMEKFSELYGYINDHKEVLRQRAPAIWSTPVLVPCETCKTEMKPVISERKEEINWLFLLLGQMLGCCKLEQLKFFCGVHSNHRTGCKNRVLYITYLVLCKQLDPDGPFSL